MKKDETLGLVTLFEPILQQLNAGSWREKRLAEMIREAQNIVSNVRGDIYMEHDNETEIVSRNNLNSSKLHLIAKMSEVM